MPSEPLKIGEAIHRLMERRYKKGAPMKPTRSDMAKQLRIETSQRERGDFVKKTQVPPTDADERYMSDADADEGGPGGAWGQQPDAALQMTQMGSSLTGYSVMEEITEDRLNGKLRPFIEGEPIGMIQKHDPKPAPMLKSKARIKEDERTEMLAMRKRNDTALDKLARRHA